jgi:hypothetical protein
MLSVQTQEGDVVAIRASSVQKRQTKRSIGANDQDSISRQPHILKGSGALWVSLSRSMGYHDSVVASFRPTVTTVGGLDRERARTALVIGLPVAVILVVLSRLATSSWELPIGLLLIAILGAAIVGWILLYLTNSSIALTAQHVLITDWRNATTVIARGDVSRLIRIGLRPFEGPPRRAVIAVDATNRGLFALGGAYDAAAIARGLSVPLSGSHDDVMSLREVNKRYPGAARSRVADPRLALVLSAMSTVLIGVIAYFVWAALRS